MPTSQLINAPTEPETIAEAVEALRHVQDQAADVLSAIRKKGKELIVLRFRQGRIASKAKDMAGESHYGKSVVANLAQQVGMNKRTLHAACRFYEHEQFGGSEAALRQWMTKKEEEKNTSITWSYCRNWTRKQLDDGKTDQDPDPKERLEEQTSKLEQKAKKLEDESTDLMEEVERIRQNSATEDDTLREAEGVALQAQQVAEDVKRQAEFAEVPNEVRYRSESHLKYVRTYRCVVCGSEQVDVSHIRSSATAKKDHDLFTWPLCREHHQEYDNGKDAFCREYDVDRWQAVAFILANRIAERQLT